MSTKSTGTFNLLLLTIVALDTMPNMACAKPDIRRFKSFVENPPPSGEVVFSYQGPPASTFNRAKNLWERHPTPVVFIRAKWENQKLITVWSASREGADVRLFTEGFQRKVAKAFVRENEAFWDLAPMFNRVTSWNGLLETPLDLTNPVLLGYFMDNLPFFSLMSMGPHFLAPGSIHWTGTRFKCNSSLLKEEITIAGTLKEGTNGIPESMLLTYRGKTISGKYLVRYEFEPTSSSVPDFIPTHIQSVVYDGEKELPDKDIRVIFMSGTSGVSHEDPEIRVQAWVDGKAPELFVYTNRLLYSVRQGALKIVPRPPPPSKPAVVLAHANRYYYTACAGICLGFLLINRKLHNDPSLRA